MLRKSDQGAGVGNEFEKNNKHKPVNKFLLFFPSDKIRGGFVK
jgi:hypothetical protein